MVPLKQKHTVQHSFQSSTMKVKTEPFKEAKEIIHKSRPEQMRHDINLLSQTPACCSNPAPPHASDLSMYLLKRELVSSGLFFFDDSPENYWAWKTSFQAVTSELNITSREEIDLFVRWLGPDLSNQAKCIKSVQVSNPSFGVHMIWRRLEDCYGCPEVIEQAMLKRLDSFPRITNKDTHPLRDLGDSSGRSTPLYNSSQHSRQMDFTRVQVQRRP